MLRQAHRLARISAAALLFAGAGETPAQPVPLGPEFPVSSATTGYAFAPDLASDGSGQFVVIWQQSGTPLSSIRGQRYDSTGAASGTEFVVGGDSLGAGDAHVAMASDGSFLVTWLSATPSILARAYDAQGSPRGDAFRVDTTIYDYEHGYHSSGDVKESPRVAAADDGFMVTWTAGFNEYLYFVHGRRSVTARRIDAGGAASDSDFSVAGDGYYFLDNPELASNAAGQFVVVWDQVTSYTYFYNQEFPYMERDPNAELRARRVGSPDSTASVTPGFARGKVSVQPSGGFLVVWSSTARLFDSTATPLGDPFQITSTSDASDVDSAANGSFTVTWSSSDAQGASDGSEYGVFARAVAADGTLLGDPILVNSYTTGSQRQPRVAFTGPDTLVAAWSGASSAHPGIVARRFARAPGCGDATADGGITANDALVALATAVGFRNCPPCVCDADASGTISASDALAMLRAAVGQPISLTCDAC